jgi:predicted ester cyclase
VKNKGFAEKLIEATYEAMINGNCDVLGKLEDPQIIYHFPKGRERIGFESHKQDILNLRPAITDLKLDMKYLTGDGNVFALTLKSSGRYISEIPGMPTPVGKSFSDDYLFVYRLSKNRIAEVWINGTTVFSD